jgi:peptidoglycan-associated lipoprotein
MMFQNARLNSQVIFRTAAIGLVAASLAACASRQPPPPAETPYTPPPAAPAPPPPPPPAPPPATVGVVPGSLEDFVASAGDRVYFDLDQYSLRSDAQATLERQAQWLARYPQVMIRIEGNADERGTREYNLALGSRRAESVRAFLSGRGVAASRITTISYGKERPIDGGSNEEAWARNRNAHTALVSGAR